MQRLAAILAISFLPVWPIAAVPAADASAVKPAAARQPSAAERVDALVKAEMDRRKIPGLSLAVVQDGRVVLAKGYGLANVELNAPATPETVYQIHSVTKSFTATAVMMLVEENKIGLDDPVAKHLDGTPESWKGITVRRLLSHTSGIKDFINEPTASLRLDVTEEEVFKATAPRPLNFKPGEKYAYSNTNYHLLAMILRKVTGQFYGDFLRRRIFDPLGMDHTRVISLSEVIPNRAAGYLPEKDGLRNGEYIAASILGYAGGGLRSTVLDLAKWDAALYSERLLKSSTLQTMWTPTKLNNGGNAPYGLGWFVRTDGGHRCVSHTGAHATGFTTVVSRYLDDKLTVIVLTNKGRIGIEPLARRIAAVYVLGLAPSAWTPIEDKEPKVTARLRALYPQLAGGQADAKQFTPEFAAFFASNRDAVRQTLGAYGPLESATLVERKDAGGNRIYRYRVRFKNGTGLLLVTLSKDDRIAGMLLEEE